MGGKADLGAQTIEFDIWENRYDAFTSGSWIRIWGPTKAQISQASDFNGAAISVYAGMQPGLPLATAAVNDGQAGLLVTGQVFQAFGNWQGTVQTLDFVMNPGVPTGTQSQPANLSFLWLQGQPLGPALQQTLAVAYPALQVVVNVSPNLVLTQTEAGVYNTLQQFATYVNGVSLNILGATPNYQGVVITIKNGVLTASDGTVASAAPPVKQILEQDLVGQVTWLDANTIQFNTVMRADMSVSRVVKMPQLSGLQAVSNANSQTNARAKNTFDGTWTVNSIRHVGNSRAPGAESWISTFTAFTNTASPASLSQADSSS